MKFRTGGSYFCEHQTLIWDANLDIVMNIEMALY